MNKFSLIYCVAFSFVFVSETEASSVLKIGQFDTDDLRETSEEYTIRTRLNNLLEIAHIKAASERKKTNASFDTLVSDDKEPQNDAEALVISSKRCINATFNRVFEQIDDHYSIRYIDAYLKDDVTRHVGVLEEVIFYEYFSWMGKAFKNLQSKDLKSGANFAIIYDGERKIAACKFSKDPQDLIGSREEVSGRRIRYEHTCTALYHFLGLTYFIDNFLTPSSLVEKYFDSNLFGLKLEQEEAPRSKATTRKTKKPAVTFGEMICALQAHQEDRETKKKEQNVFFDKTIVSLADMREFLRAHKIFESVFYGALDPDNMGKLFAMWYIGYQRDMHGANLLLKFTDHGKIFIYGFDFEHSLEERYATLSAKSILEVRAPEFMRMLFVQKMKFPEQLIRRFKNISFERIEEIVLRILPDFNINHPNELNNLKNRIERLAEFASTGRNSNLEKLYRNLTHPSIHPLPLTLLSKNQAWPQVRGVNWLD